MTLKTPLRTAGLVLITALLAVVGYSVYGAARTKDLAEDFFRAAQTLEIEKSTMADVLQVARSSGGEQYGFEPCARDTAQCTGTVYFENAWLRRWRLAPPTYFACRFGIAEHKLTRRWCGMVSYRAAHAGSSVDWGVFVDERASTRSFPNEIVSRPQDRVARIAPVPSTELIGITITPNASSDIRALAKEFNFNCLIRIGGCKTREEMLPLARLKALLQAP